MIDFANISAQSQYHSYCNLYVDMSCLRYLRATRGHFLLWLILALDQTIFRVDSQELSTRSARPVARYNLATPSNTSLTISSANRARSIAVPLMRGDLRGLNRRDDTKAHDATTGYHNRSLQALARRAQDDGQPDDMRIPFWNIAHMINSIREIEPALNEGANGIEVDISFDRRGIPVETYHGFPCDCGRHCHQNENFIKFLDYIGQMTSLPSSLNRLQLIIFDLKLKDLGYNQKELAGDYMAAKINEHIYKRYLDLSRNSRGSSTRPPVRIIVSINHVDDNVLARAFIEHMRKNNLDFMSQQVGFDVGMNDDLGEISSMWNGLNGATLNIWQGDGLTNCANIVRGLERLKTAISMRNQQGHFRKIYYWTADVMYQIRSVLNLGLDAILTNQPQRVLQVLEEREYKMRYRLATPYDDPFAQYSIQPSAWKMSAPSLSEVVETVSNIRETSANFVKNLPDGIAAAIKKVQGSISVTS